MTPIEKTEELTRNRAAFERLVCLAISSRDKGNADLAVAYSQVAAQFAWLNHTGLFASESLEGILTDLGRRTLRNGLGDRAMVRTARSPLTVLHVMTSAYSIGGHTRLVKRWIDMDARRAHSLVLTRQGSTPVPRWLPRAVHTSGGSFHYLDRKMGGLLSRADRLRTLAAGADCVVLHIHPSDVVPIVALADKRGLPPIIFLNHADHVFWLGTSTGDVVANIRQSGVDLSYARRGVDRERCSILPIPLGPPRRTMLREQAKSRLGLPQDAIVLLSLASEYKYTNLGDMTFLDLIVPVLESCCRAILLVVGPSGGGEWGDVARKLPGRVRVLGTVEEPSLYFQAADIYIDSFPFGSLTSLLEAGSYGTPVISFSPFTADAAVLRPDDPAIDNGSLRVADVARYRACIEHLIQDETLRTTLGEKTQEKILQVHTGPGWVGYLEELYGRAGILRAAPPNEEVHPSQNPTQLDSLLVHIHTKSELSSQVEDVMISQIGFLPFRQRLALWLRNPNRGRIPLRCVLASEGAHAVLRGLTRNTAQPLHT